MCHTAYTTWLAVNPSWSPASSGSKLVPPATAQLSVTSSDRRSCNNLRHCGPRLTHRQLLLSVPFLTPVPAHQLSTRQIYAEGMLTFELVPTNQRPVLSRSSHFVSGVTLYLSPGSSKGESIGTMSTRGPPEPLLWT